MFTFDAICDTSKNKTKLYSRNNNISSVFYVTRKFYMLIDNKTHKLRESPKKRL